MQGRTRLHNTVTEKRGQGEEAHGKFFAAQIHPAINARRLGSAAAAFYNGGL
jgi:hypothetical protein